MKVNEEKLVNRKKQRKNAKKRKILVTVVIALLSILIVGAVVVWGRISKAENAIHQEVETVNLRDKEIEDNGSFSVLLLGIDNGAYGREGEVGRSDSMLLVTVNPKQKKTTMISIPRDTYTEIIGYGTFDKINHAYAFGKEQFSINSVQNLFNIPIDYYVTVDMHGLMGLVDAVDGIDITPALTFTYEGESFTEGVTRHVDGEAALRYARMRYDDPEGDTGRQKRQQYVIQKIVEKLLTLSSISKFEEILKTLENSVKTDFTVEKLVSIAQTHKEALQHFETDTVAGQGEMINGIYYFVVPEEEKIRISNVLRKSLDLDPIQELQHIETKEVQTTANIEQNVPQRNSNIEEQNDTYVEPNVTPSRNYNDNNYSNYNNQDDSGAEEQPTPSRPATQVTPSTQVTPATEQPQTQAPTTQAPVTQAQPATTQNP